MSLTTISAPIIFSAMSGLSSEPPTIPPATTPIQASTPNIQLPDACSIGRVQQYDPETATDAVVALSSAAVLYSQPYQWEAWAEFGNAFADLWGDFDYLRMEAPSHVLRGVSTRYKANLFDIKANVRFHNSENGYVGTDKSNFEANAYEYMTFEDTHGFALVWAARSDICSGQGVWVQETPTVTLLNRTNGKATIAYSIDPYSRAALAGESAEVRVSGMVPSFFGPRNVIVETHTVPPSEYGEFTIDVSKYGKIRLDVGVYDGTFTSKRAWLDGTD